MRQDALGLAGALDDVAELAKLVRQRRSRKRLKTRVGITGHRDQPAAAVLGNVGVDRGEAFLAVGDFLAQLAGDVEVLAHQLSLAAAMH
jgi:hypothetical protein